jgi:hypothetical protein
MFFKFSPMSMVAAAVRQLLTVEAAAEDLPAELLTLFLVRCCQLLL